MFGFLMFGFLMFGFLGERSTSPSHKPRI